METWAVFFGTFMGLIVCKPGQQADHIIIIVLCCWSNVAKFAKKRSSLPSREAEITQKHWENMAKSRCNYDNVAIIDWSSTNIHLDHFWLRDVRKSWLITGHFENVTKWCFIYFSTFLWLNWHINQAPAVLRESTKQTKPTPELVQRKRTATLKQKESRLYVWLSLWHQLFSWHRVCLRTCVTR